MKPLRIEIEMVTPIVMAHPWIHFDAVIAHLWLRRELGEEMYLLPSKSPVDFGKEMQLELPLAKFERNGEWVWCGSVSFVERDGELELPSGFYGTRIYKRFEVERLGLLAVRQKKVYRGSGKYRDYMMTLPYLPVKKVVFFCKGEKGEIVSLLKHLVGLGKKVKVGFGEIKKIRVIEWDLDESLVLRDGRASRPIPVDMCEWAEEKAWLACCVPYWAKGNVKLCCVPGRRVRM